MARIKKNDSKKTASVHKELQGLDLTINEFGEIVGNKNIDEINAFLGRHVTDRKLEDRAGDFGEKPEDGQ
ncbi:MAG: hypothetical protein HYZ16_05145 [Bacteroidetes bacterium]|jgi:hypothetical protein|nr:hypothetical protein [Bacteroidota bacterium]